MKRTIVLFSAVLISAITFAQKTPEAFNYQGVARNSDGAVIASQTIGIKIAIKDPKGTAYYTEYHNSTNTNAMGLFSLQVGKGNTEDVFGDIPWGAKDFYMETSMMPPGGSSWILMGSSQLLSMPYALHAKEAENVFSGNYEDLTGTPSQLFTDTTFQVNINGQNVNASSVHLNNPSTMTFASRYFTVSEAGDIHVQKEEVARKYNSDPAIFETVGAMDMYFTNGAFYETVTPDPEGSWAHHTGKSIFIRPKKSLERCTGNKGYEHAAFVVDVRDSAYEKITYGNLFAVSNGFVGEERDRFAVRYDGKTYATGFAIKNYDVAGTNAAVEQFSIFDDGATTHFANTTENSKFEFNNGTVKANEFETENWYILGAKDIDGSYAIVNEMTEGVDYNSDGDQNDLVSLLRVGGTWVYKNVISNN